MSPLNRKNEPPIGRRNHEKCTCIGFFTADAKQTKNEPLAMLRKNELNICSYKYKNRLKTTRTKEDNLICSVWHLLEVVFRSSEVVQIEHCLSNSFTMRHQTQGCCCLVCSKERSVSFCSKSYHELFQNRPNLLTNCFSQKLST